MSGGKIKSESSNVKTYMMNDNDYMFVVDMENAKQALLSGISAAINRMQVSYLHKIGVEQFNLEADKNYKFDLDLTTKDSEQKKLFVEEVKD